MALTPGTRLGPYEIISALGAGGMGEVWKARDRRVDRVVAIKRLKAEHTDRFRREARAIAALNHPRICQLYDVGPDYLVMEYSAEPWNWTRSIPSRISYSAQWQLQTTTTDWKPLDRCAPRFQARGPTRCSRPTTFMIATMALC